jgi:hypothetical protein
MNEPNPPPSLPNSSQGGAPLHPPLRGDQPLGTDPNEREPIPSAFTAAETLLRQPRRILFHLVSEGQGVLVLKLVGIALASAVGYGLVVGTFSGGDQFWAAPVKVAAGLLLSALICLPSLYIFACLSGAQTRLGEVCGLVAGLLAMMTVLLIGFAPVAWVFSQSTESVTAMGALHLMFWGIATAFALRFLSGGFAQLKADLGAGLQVWTVIFVMVMLQMSTALRPIIGTSDAFLPKEKKFFVSHWSEQMKSTGPALKR